MTPAYRECARYARALGLADDGIDGAGHHRFVNPDGSGRAYVVSTTMADTARAVVNTKAGLRRAAGVDTRGAEHVDGERRTHRPRKAFRPSGFSLDAAAREARAFERRQAAREAAEEREAAEAARRAAAAPQLAEFHTQLSGLLHELYVRELKGETSGTRRAWLRLRASSVERLIASLDPTYKPRIPRRTEESA